MWALPSFSFLGPSSAFALSYAPSLNRSVESEVQVIHNTERRVGSAWHLRHGPAAG